MSSPHPLTVHPLVGIPEVVPDQNPARALARLLNQALSETGLALRDGDVLAVSSKLVSKAGGLTADPHDRTRVIAGESVAVLAERRIDPADAAQITRVVQARAGPVLAAAGVDASNTGGRDVLLLLPRDPDEVCRVLRETLTEATGVRRLGVLLTDTAGRPWRVGQTDFALGAAGLRVIDDLRGNCDADGRPLRVTIRAVADEIAGAADLIKGKATGIPAVLVRGLAELVLDPREHSRGSEPAPGARALVRAGDNDWFALGAQEAVRTALGVPPGSSRAQRVGIRPTSGDTSRDRIARAVSVATDPEVSAWAADVMVDGPGDFSGGSSDRPGGSSTGRPEAGVITVTATDAFSAGMIVSRLLTALAGEGVPHRVLDVHRSPSGTRVRLGPDPLT